LRVSKLRLALELARWRAAGRHVQLWWRDDDARAPTPALERLLALSAARQAPLTLAVIPDSQPAALATCLAAHPQVTVVQHGVDHQNRREGRAAGEFAHEWNRLRVTTQLRAGWSRLELLPGAFRAYVPPWNDVHPELATALEDCGYAAWSAWGGCGAAAGPPRVDAHLDLLRWKKGVRFRGERRLYDALRDALAERRRAGRWDLPVGLLTHHLDHDEAAWAFLDAFLARTGRDPLFTWRSLPELSVQVVAMRLRRAANPVI
jgi:hypothetical protein